MGRYDATRNQYLRGASVTPFPLAARTATVQSAAQPCAEFASADLTLTVSAVAGTAPTLDVTVETREYGGAWVAIGTAFTQKVGAGAQRLVFAGLREEMRAVATIGGSAGQSVTFSLDGYFK